MLGGLAVLSINTTLGYRVAILVNAASSFIVAIMALWLEPIATRYDSNTAVRAITQHSSLKPPTKKQFASAFFDARFMIVTIYLELIAIGLYAMNLAIPVWMVRYTAMPAVLIGVYKATETVVGITMHTVLTRRSNTVSGGVLDLRRWGLISGAACIMLAGCALTAQWNAVGLFLVVCLLAALSTVGLNGATWAISYAMRQDGKQGEYESANQMIDGVLSFALPYAILPLCGGTPVNGWIIIGLFTIIVAFGAPLLHSFARLPKQEATQHA